jgi:hypothetical protein
MSHHASALPINKNLVKELISSGTINPITGNTFTMATYKKVFQDQYINEDGSITSTGQNYLDDKIRHKEDGTAKYYSIKDIINKTSDIRTIERLINDNVLENRRQILMDGIVKSVLDSDMNVKKTVYDELKKIFGDDIKSRNNSHHRNHRNANSLSQPYISGSKSHDVKSHAKESLVSDLSDKDQVPGGSDNESSDQN